MSPPLAHLAAPPLAHLGHWYGQIIFAAPLLLLLALAGLDKVRRRWRGRGRRGA